MEPSKGKQKTGQSSNMLMNQRKKKNDAVTKIKAQLARLREKLTLEPVSVVFAITNTTGRRSKYIKVFGFGSLLERAVDQFPLAAIDQEIRYKPLPGEKRKKRKLVEADASIEEDDEAEDSEEDSERLRQRTRRTRSSYARTSTRKRSSCGTGLYQERDETSEDNENWDADDHSSVHGAEEQQQGLDDANVDNAKLPFSKDGEILVNGKTEHTENVSEESVGNVPLEVNVQISNATNGNDESSFENSRDLETCDNNEIQREGNGVVPSIKDVVSSAIPDTGESEKRVSKIIPSISHEDESGSHQINENEIYPCMTESNNLTEKQVFDSNGVLQDESPTLLSKCKEGPPSLKKSPKEEIVAVPINQGITQVTKRKRGRPRKQRLEESSERSEEHTETPAKNATESEGLGADSVPTKRKRGRPRKLHIESNIQNLESQTKDESFISTEPIRPFRKRRKRTKRNHPNGFQCSICDRVFKTTAARADHMRIHTGEKPYLCTTCGKAFRTEVNLRTHTRTHTGERPYVCKVCGSRYAQSGTLQIHMRRHTGERPFKCDVCGMAFPGSSAMQRHRRTHEVGKHVCEICNKAYPEACYLAQHMRLHTGEKPHRCSLCSKTFRTSQAYHRHKISHTTERPHMCEICCRTYRHRQSLVLHQREHTGDYRFHCLLCDRKYTVKYMLDRHMASRHSSVQDVDEEDYVNSAVQHPMAMVTQLLM